MRKSRTTTEYVRRMRIFLSNKGGVANVKELKTINKEKSP